MVSKRWPVTINDAPLQCGKCGESFLGTGTGPFSVLVEALNRHVENCGARAGKPGPAPVTEGED
jgi:hypothetical protein